MSKELFHDFWLSSCLVPCAEGLKKGLPWGLFQLGVELKCYVKILWCMTKKKDKKCVFSPTPHVFRRRIAWFDQSPHGPALGMQPAPRVSCSLQLQEPSNEHPTGDRVNKINRINPGSVLIVGWTNWTSQMYQFINLHEMPSRSSMNPCIHTCHS
jgi:hypothetical protein